MNKKTWILFIILIILICTGSFLLFFNKKDSGNNDNNNDNNDNNNITEPVKTNLPEFPKLDASLKSLSIIDQKNGCVENNCLNIDPFSLTKQESSLNDFNITFTCTEKEPFSGDGPDFCMTYEANINNIIKFKHEVGDYEPTGIYILKTNEFYIIEEGTFGNLYGIGNIYIYNTSRQLLKTINNTVADFQVSVELDTTDEKNPLGTYKMTISDNKLYYLTTDNINDGSGNNKVHFNYIDLKDKSLTSKEYNSIKAITSNEID